MDDLRQIAIDIAAKNIQLVPNNMIHFFISYRQATDKSLASSLYFRTLAKSTEMDECFGVPGLKPSLFLDVISLKDGEDWQERYISV